MLELKLLFSLLLQPIYFHVFLYILSALPLSSLLSACAVCSSVQLHSPLEGDQEYLLLEECESKTLPPQASL